MPEDGRGQLGIGLASMEGASPAHSRKDLTISSTPEKGTTVEVRVPLEVGDHE